MKSIKIFIIFILFLFSQTVMAEIIQITDGWSFNAGCKSLKQVYLDLAQEHQEDKSELPERLKAGLFMLNCAQALSTNFNVGTFRVNENTFIYAYIDGDGDKSIFHGFVIAVLGESGIFIRRLVSSPDAKVQGVGTLLVEKVINEFPTHEISLKALPSSIGFYQRLGFVIISSAIRTDTAPMVLYPLQRAGESEITSRSVHLARWHWDLCHGRFRFE